MSLVAPANAGGDVGLAQPGELCFKGVCQTSCQIVYCSDNRLLRIFLIVEDFFIFASLWEVLSCILFLAGLARQTLMFLIIARC